MLALLARPGFSSNFVAIQGKLYPEMRMRSRERLQQAMILTRYYSELALTGIQLQLLVSLGILHNLGPVA